MATGLALGYSGYCGSDIDMAGTSRQIKVAPQVDRPPRGCGGVGVLAGFAERLAEVAGRIGLQLAVRVGRVRHFDGPWN